MLPREMTDFFARLARNTDPGGAGGAPGGAADGTGQGAAAAQGGAPATPPGGAPPNQPPAAEKPWLESAALDPAVRALAINNGFHKVRGDDGTMRDAAPEHVVTKALQAYEAAAQKLGANPAELLRAPKQGQDVAEWRRTHGSLLGVPESPDKYAIERPKLPEGVPYDEGFEKRALERLHAKGMPRDLAQEVVALYAEEIGAKFSGLQAQAAEAKQAMLAELQRDWGQQTQAKLQQAAGAFQHFAARAGLDAETQGALIAAMSDKTGDARLLKLFAAIGEAMGEDRIVDGAGNGAGAAIMTPVEAQARLSAIKAPNGDFAQARARGDDRRMAELRAEIGRLSRIVAPPGA